MNLQKAQEYFYHLHDIECNQKYDKKLPYSFHLDMVLKQVQKFSYLIKNRYSRANPEKNMFNLDTIWDEIVVSAFGHDSIEDARLTYNDIKELYGDRVADIIYLCTEDKGKTRAERKSEKWYNELKTNDLAVFIKLCDIIANVKYSFLTNSSMFGKYKQEYEEKVKPFLYKEEYKDMFTHLDKIFEI